MNARRDSDPVKNRTTADRKSERELVVTRTFNAPARLVFEAWTKPELLKRWWVPKSFGISFLSCEADIRTGGCSSCTISTPRKKALDDAIASGSTSGMGETLQQLDELLVALSTAR